jgi:hypothetical protein
VVSGPERLAAIVTALEGLGIPHLVMGGHAVRYYGVDRNTIDFDLHISLDAWDTLPALLANSPLFTSAPPVEGPSGRAGVFRRFQVGRLDDGREEWLEFWRSNHLLAPFPDLVARSDTGPYGGRDVRFLGLGDLIRSKETERASDWQDVALLEEIATRETQPMPAAQAIGCPRFSNSAAGRGSRRCSPLLAPPRRPSRPRSRRPRIPSPPPTSSRSLRAVCRRIVSPA